jgi:hypothetical protein
MTTTFWSYRSISVLLNSSFASGVGCWAELNEVIRRATTRQEKIRTALLTIGSLLSAYDDFEIKQTADTPLVAIALPLAATRPSLSSSGPA